MLITENDGDNYDDDNGVDDANNVMEVCHISPSGVSTLPTYILELMITIMFVMMLMISVGTDV